MSTTACVVPRRDDARERASSTDISVFKLVDALEDSDDVQNVYTNVDLSDEVLAELDEG